MTHVDDFFCSGRHEDLEWFAGELGNKFELKRKMIGGGANDDRVGTFLNRNVAWTEEGYIISGDDKHVKILLDEWGMDSCNGVDNPIASKPLVNEEEDRDSRDLMDTNDAWRYRRGAARINYMAQDRMDICVAAQRLSQNMAHPRVGDEMALKRVIRFLKSHPSCSFLYGFQGDNAPMTIMTDSDWAGDVVTRKSTSGGLIRMNSHVISFWCKSQATVALSSGEAELNSMVKGCSEGIGVLELMRELGCDASVYAIQTDSSAARGTVMRHGAGRIKHLSTKQLWIQGAVKYYGILPVKICRSINSADLLTHQCSTRDFNNHIDRLGLIR